MTRSLFDINIVPLFLAFLMLCPSTAAATDPQPAEKVLTFLNWADYMDPELISKFEEQYKVTVSTITYESDDARTQMLLSTGGENFDIAVIDGDSIEVYSKRGWLEPLSAMTIPNLRFIQPRWQNAYSKAAQFAVPYFWGTTGIAYRSDLVAEPISKWMQIYRPAPPLQGKIFMLPQNRELIDITLKTLGYSVNTTEKKAYEEARALLLEQKPYVKKYDVPAVNEHSALVSGEVIAAMTYNGDALMLTEANENIVYVTPEEGGVLWADYLVVMAKARNKELAQTFINFLNEPENAAQLARFVYYASPNSEAEKLLPDDFLNDKTIYPPKEILEKYEIEEIVPPRIMRLRASIFSEVTSGKI